MDFDKLYSEQFQPTYVFIRYMVGHAELAEDLTQETFYRIYKAKNLDRVAKSAVYVRQVARNLVYDYYRKKALIKWLPFTTSHEQHEVTYVPEDWLLQQEQRKVLFEALQQLKPLQREILIYRKIEERSIEETCNILGLTAMKVANTQRSAMKKLEQLLGGAYDEA